MSVRHGSLDYVALRNELLDQNSHAATASGTQTRYHQIQHVPPMNNGEDDSLAGFGLLPSTVPETLQGEHAGLAVQADEQRPQRQPHGGEQNMSGGESPNDTQPLSQSFVDDYVRRSRSAINISQTENEPPAVPDNDETQMTALEGDDGFVDICSSYRPGDQDDKQNLDDAADSEPITFSPTQTQPRLTQYPESQRWKTPATVAKKRDVTGNIVDTPANTRNPLANTAGTTPARLLGLSQAFDATQAVSSPITNLALTQLRSDRPSPNFDLQPRSNIGPISSPMRPLTESRRAGSEPVSNYVPIHHSQAARRSVMEPDETPSKNYESQVSGRDGFSDEPSLVVRNRRILEREERARQDLEKASSPTSPRQAISRSSNTTTTRTASVSAVLHSSPPIVVNTTDQPLLEGIQAAAISEHESARASNVEHKDTSLSAAHHGDEDADASDRITQVLRTSKRQSGVRSGNASSVIDSPLSGRVKARPTADVPEEPNSSAHIRVVNSQPARSRITGDQPIVAENDDAVEIIPASQEQDGTDLSPSAEININLMGSAIPETSSNERQGVNDTATQKSHPGTKSLEAQASTYRTAPTSLQQPPQSSPAVHDESSQPVRAPGRKRKRMTDVAQESSPARHTSQENSFRPSQVLALSQNPDTADALLLSPTRQRYSPRKRQRRGSQEALPVLEASETKSSTENTNSANIGRRIEDRPTAERTAAPTGEWQAQEEHHGSRPQTRHKNSDLPQTPAKILKPTSTWDLGPSPIQNKLPRSTKAMDGPTKRPTRNRKSATQIAVSSPDQQPQKRENQPAATAPSKLDDSPDPLAASFASTAPSKDDVPRPEIVAPQMVFACYFGKTRTYHPAIWLGPDPADDSRFKIQWKGYDPDSLDRHGVCALELRVGDLVKVDMDGFAKVAHVVRELKDKMTSAATKDAITDVFGHQTVVVAPKHRKSMDDELVKSQEAAVPVSAIYLDSNLWTKIQSRGMMMDNKSEPQTLVSTPASAVRVSKPTTPQSRSNKVQKSGDTPQVYQTSGLFAEMAFALSFEASSRRDQIARTIGEHGGTVIEGSFADLLNDEFNVKSEFSSGKFCALLADKHSRKEKYMQALALGLPCLSGRWIERCVQRQQLVPWQDYLLPAGESTVLDGAVRSRVLSYNAVEQPSLRSMIQQRKDFFGQDEVIFLTGRGKAEGRRTPYLFFVRAMQAGRIHKVPDLQAAEELLTREESPTPKWLIVDEKEVELAKQMLSAEEDGRKKRRKRAQESTKSCQLVDTESIVQSLILGRWFDPFDT